MAHNIYECNAFILFLNCKISILQCFNLHEHTRTARRVFDELAQL